RKQMTPLIYAARKGYPQVAALLVARGSHINAQDENGYSALIWAAQKGHKTVVFKLLELGADKNVQTKDKKTAAELAKINKHSEIYSLLSLAANHLEGRYQETVKQEAICTFLTAVPDHRAGSYSTFNDMEVFLHGVGLEHVIGLLKERSKTLKQLLIMQKDELIQIGITNPEDQQKVLDAVTQLQLEVTRTEDLPEVMNLESRISLYFCSGDEFLQFLRKLNNECSRLSIPLQTMNEHFLKNSQKMVLQWASTESFIEVCEDLLNSVESLRVEVTKLKDLIEKHEQKDDTSRVKLPDKAPTLKNILVKIGAVTLLGFGFSFFIAKSVIKKT
ncbi:Ankyrin repeat, SAM and basic leucine zipper domain-containing protein 1, partial [Chaetura pelagica]